MEDFLATVPRPADTVGRSGAVTPKYFCTSQNFVVLRKFRFKHMIKIKIFSSKYVFPPQTVNGPDSAKIVFAIKVWKTIRPFRFEGYLASRCSITSKIFFINHH